MHPAFSVLLLTTLIGAGQGLFLVLFATEVAALAGLVPKPPMPFLVGGGALALALTGAGLVARSSISAGRSAAGVPRRAGGRRGCRARSSCCRCSWPACSCGAQRTSPASAGRARSAPRRAVLAVALFVCTGMIYASLRLLQEWATPLTPLNYLLLGCASGAVLAAAYAALAGSSLAAPYALAALLLTIAGAATRIASLARNRALRPKSTLQTAIGIPHPQIAQRSQGLMGGSFNTREFFHGATPAKMRAIKWSFLLLAFAAPIALLAFGGASAPVLVGAFALQYLGLLAERWYFFAEANHPQNLYYQAMS